MQYNEFNIGKLNNFFIIYRYRSENYGLNSMVGVLGIFHINLYAYLVLGVGVLSDFWA